MEQFDAAAHAYDTTFSFSCVGKAQRDQVWKYVDRYVTSSATRVLEVNCGTGEDAKRWHERKKNIVSSDISPEMISVAQHKFPEIAFECLDIEQLAASTHTADTLFSNFGGLNCLSTDSLLRFFESSAQKLPQNGKLVVVIMGKKCLWDRLFLIAKRRFKEVSRRNTDEAIHVNVDGESVPTWYYSPNEIAALSESNFRCVAKHPIGLFVPPSYLAAAFERRPRIFGAAKWLDSVFTHPSLSNYADHYLMVLEKK